MQVREAGRDRIIKRQNATCELWSNLAVKPRAQPCALCGIPALHAKHSSLQFMDCDGRDEEVSRIFCSNPRYDMGISFAVADLA